jgi:chemotaxis protein methyltransferase CheR
MSETPAADLAVDVGFAGKYAISPREFELFRTLVYRETGIALRESKTAMLSSRLSRRMRQLNLSSFETYYEYLLNQDKESGEFREFINSVTTNKTSFFRENHHFDFLSELLRKPRLPGPLRIWSAACSSGEEPYSIAMVLSEVFSPLAGRDIRILASDIDTNVLQTAAESLYDAETVAEIPGVLRSKYLVSEANGLFRIKEDLRDLITFRHRNLISSAWNINTKFDVIFCRNVLIYFDHETQDQILRRFVSFIKPGGHLIVGHSEHPHWLTDLIEPQGRTIYRVK